MNWKQDENENLISCTQKFKADREVLSSNLGGSIVLHEIIKNDDNCNENDTIAAEKAQKEADERLAACLYLANSDKKKHASVLKI